MKMKKIKHDKELEKLAEKLMKMPFNSSAVDKTYVSQSLFYFNDHFKRVRRNGIH